MSLAKSDIRLFVDGRSKANFTYDGATDKLKYKQQKKYKSGTYHQVKIIARDSQGAATLERWRFKVVR